MRKVFYIVRSRMVRETINRKITSVRFWLFRLLFTADEKYLMIRAIEDRIENLQRIAVIEKWADYHNIQEDCRDYSKLKTIFSTRYWM